MRKLANTIALENLFNAVPGKNSSGYPAGSGSLLLKAFSEKVFRPNVPVVKEDCGTKLGRLVYADTDLIGKTTLSDVMGGAGNTVVLCPKDKIITEEDLNKILKGSIPKVRVRTLDSCVALSPEGTPGVCRKCLHASASYTFKVSFPEGTTSSSFVDFGTLYPLQPIPKYWLLEDVRNNTRYTYVVYYNDESILLGDGSPRVRTPSGVTELPALVPASDPVTYVRVAILKADSLETVLRKTAEALDYTGDFTCSVSEGSLLIRDVVYSNIAEVNIPYSPTSNYISGISYQALSRGEKTRLDQHSLGGFYDRLAESYSGSLLGVRKATDQPLPFREELFYHIVSDNDVAIAYRDLNKVLGKKVPLDMLRYIDEIPDRLEKSLLIIAVYTIYSFIRA